MGRPKGSKNKKTLAKVTRTKARKAVPSANVANDLVTRVAVLEGITSTLTNAHANIIINYLENKLETLNINMCSLLHRVDLLEQHLRPLMFIERTDKDNHEKENESSSSQEGQQEIQEN